MQKRTGFAAIPNGRHNKISLSPSLLDQSVGGYIITLITIAIIVNLAEDFGALQNQ